MKDPAHVAVGVASALGAALLVGAVAYAATPTTPTTTTPTTTAPAPAPPPATTVAEPEPETTVPATTPARPPRLTSLRVPPVITAQQGHAQILIGAKTSTAARLRVQLVNARTKKLVRTVTAAEAHAAGRVYFHFEATTEQRFQLPAGTYQVTVQATDALGKVSNKLTGTMRLRLTEPRGTFDAYTVPMWPSLAKQFGVASGGMLVAAVAPKGVAVTAGVRRGDIVTSLNGLPTVTSGGYAEAVRRLPANRGVPVETSRDGQPLPWQVTFKPDWEKVPEYGPSLAVIVRRDPTKLAYAYAHARQIAEAGDAAAARDAVQAWRKTWRESSAAHLLLGDLLYAENKMKEALGAYNRAIAADPALALAHIGRGLALTELNRGQEAADAFASASDLDPVNADAHAYRAYALLRVGPDQATTALDAANRAVSLDITNEEGHIARGLALIAAGRKPDGVTALRKGLLLLNDPERARKLITESLEPNDP